jgi:L-ascorbate metabolism protein UlaG (beta-lactamase superfamily)
VNPGFAAFVPLAALLAACALLANCKGTQTVSNDKGAGGTDSAGDSVLGSVPPSDSDSADTDPADTDAGDSAPDSTGDPVVDDPLPLEVRFLAVGGFHLKVGDSALITAPLYSNPDLWETLTDPVESDPGVIGRYLGDVSDAKALLVGHAHYDHLLDVPFVRNQTDDATIYGNEAVANILAAFSPEPSEECTDREDPTEPFWVPTDRVVNVDEFVDFQNCGTAEPCVDYSPTDAGEWIPVEGTQIRIKPICSTHPDQFWVIHFGQGCINEPQCAAPSLASDWLEGTTLAWLIDFLDDAGQPIFRVYYQDAPTDVPTGLPSGDDLMEKGIDLALLNAGNYEAVADAPGGTIRWLQPRYVIMGHWEDFFRTLDQPLDAIPFMDLDDLRLRLETELPGGEDTLWWIPDPGTEFQFEVE